MEIKPTGIMRIKGRRFDQTKFTGAVSAESHPKNTNEAIQVLYEIRDRMTATTPEIRSLCLNLEGYLLLLKSKEDINND